MILHIMCLLYMFLGIAIICDDYFVSSLEMISESLRLSDDVAGATFMAAGGSAPEFATSTIGVFISKSDVGFGTIVGSAVFNILFVIGLCAYFSGQEKLQLTWYPLMRDASFYVICLGVLVALVSDREVTWPDAVIMTLLYLLYVAIMKFDPKIKRFIISFEAKHVRLTSSPSKITPHGIQVAPESSPATASGDGSSVPVEQGVECSEGQQTDSPWKRVGELSPYELGVKTNGDETTKGSSDKTDNASSNNGALPGTDSPVDGVLQRLHHDLAPVVTTRTAEMSASRTAEMSASFFRAAKPIEEATFKRGKPFKPVLQSRVSLSKLARHVTAAAPDMFKPQEKNKGQPNEMELSAAPTVARPTPESPQLDGDKAQDDDDKAQDDGDKAQDVEAGGEEDEEKTSIFPQWPDGAFNRFKFLILAPLTFSFAVTVPDCRMASCKRLFALTFIMSIVWIALLTYIMVWMAEQICYAIELPPSVAGVSILAAGTSIPDAITSVLVAREGHGDMALSSSIGSNVFDITFGLPVPWLLYTGIYKTNSVVQVHSKSMPIQVGTLMFMVLIVVVVIHMYGWSINKPMGIAFFILYFVFLTEAILLELDPAGLF